MHQSITDGGWEKEFDEEFINRGHGTQIDRRQVKSFLRTQISEAVEKERERILAALERMEVKWLHGKPPVKPNAEAVVVYVIECCKNTLRSLKDTSHTEKPCVCEGCKCTCAKPLFGEKYVGPVFCLKCGGSTDTTK